MKKEWKRFTALALGAFMVLQAAGCSPQKYGKQPEGGADVWRGFKGIFRGGRRKDGDTPDVELGKYGGGSYRQ